MAKGDIPEALDNPVIYLVVLTVGVASLMAIFAWIAKSRGSSGAAAFFGHP